MRLNSKGQVTIPAHLREKCGLRPGDEEDVIEEDGGPRVLRREENAPRGPQAAHRMRGSAAGGMSTDEIMKLLRGE
ncbi:AbrB/MazE/SpoVT family DNA-binding domain-containing protein [Streptomyces durbertensis]|uniref:AbrB/MazE/SpoVT family DNA-binding domain-containing protein n=1 Tax=Streptomyces durbertensis TaxID=2448886 RepID=A0ABR6EFW7_9ACTN|nr:AbrB/MazE/SpoVT family DNA-binding domain-containing protein [Streptomyces durbertensis]MBB1244163.1 AbrB/MazE/SpoVT family DNA-binding domain-containing protein [Streptomyces durbertensis]